MRVLVCWLFCYDLEYSGNDNRHTCVVQSNPQQPRVTVVHDISLLVGRAYFSYAAFTLGRAPKRAMKA